MKKLHLALLLSISFISKALPKMGQAPFTIRADRLNQDQKLGTVTAEGQVTVYHEKYILQADRLTYSRSDNHLYATGNVTLTQPSQEVIFSDYVALSGDFKNGIIRHIRMILADDAKFAAVVGKREDGKILQMEKLVYSPCRVCRKDPNATPLWQLKSETAQWNEEEESITYTDAVLEFFGMPVFYTPYLRHAYRRSSGLLAPTYEHNPSTGSVVIVPYYYVIGEDKDMTLQPLVTSKGGTFVAAEYRQRLSRAKITLAGSGGQSKRYVHHSSRRTQRSRWHIDSHMRFHLNPQWRLGTDIVRASDQTYLKQYPYYGYADSTTLTSIAYGEGFYGRNYINLQAVSFQGLREQDDSKRTPLMLPYGSFEAYAPGFLDGRWRWHTNLLGLSRSKGTQVRRMTSQLEWQKVSSTPIGDEWTFGAEAHGHFYNVSRFRQNYPNAPEKSAWQGRTLPKGFIDWRYPWMIHQGETSYIIGPIASAVAAPKVKNHHRFPNEDSLFLEIDDLSLLQHNRFPGYDRLDDGSRLTYGLEAHAYSATFPKADFFVGQTYHSHKQLRHASGIGEKKRKTDYFVRTNVELNRYLDVFYRTQILRTSFRPVRQELGANAGPAQLRANVRFIALPKYVVEDQTLSSKQISLGLQSNFIENWTAAAGTTRDLSQKSKSLSHYLGLEFENECLKFVSQLSKSFYRDRDLKPGSSIMFRLTFKTLGEVRQKRIIGRKSQTPTDSGKM